MTTNTYTFCFGSSDQLIELNEEQLNQIPYLLAVISRKDDFTSIRNENGQYKLSSLFGYNCFKAILSTIDSENPYVLFNELPENENIIETLELHDYLNIKCYSLPDLAINHRLVLDGVETKMKPITYRKVTIPEARRTAGEFLVALSQNRYNLNDDKTNKCIFSLIKEILSNSSLFSSRFRHHAFAIGKHYCFPYFSSNRQSYLTALQKIKFNNINSLLYFDDDYQLDRYDFTSIFTWQGSFILEMRIANEPVSKTIRNNGWLSSFYYWDYFLGYCWEYLSIEKTLDDFGNDQCQQNNKDSSKHFNKVIQQPKVDKFKHRCGPKAQKYR